MSDDAKAFYQTWSSRMSRAKSEARNAAGGFGSLYQAVMKPGALTVREKELVALGIAMALRCEPCIYTHAEKARFVGATREEIMEGASVAVMMQGGPTYTYLPKLVEALDEIDGRQPAGPAGGGQATGRSTAVTT